MLGWRLNIAQAGSLEKRFRAWFMLFRRRYTKMKEQADRRRLVLERHLASLRACRSCPKMQSPPVPGRPVISRVMLVGQAPGAKEPELGRPFAWTAGKAMFEWFKKELGVDEEQFRRSVYMTAVCRCFPG